MRLLLDYDSTKLLSILLDGEVVARYVALGFKQREVLVDGVPAIELRYIVNSPERFEHLIRCLPVSAEDGHVSVEQIPNDPTVNENVYMYSFEPLTLAAWKSAGFVGTDDELKTLQTDEDVRNYYWSDWVPSYWTRELDPWG